MNLAGTGFQNGKKNSERTEKTIVVADGDITEKDIKRVCRQNILHTL